MDLTAERDTKLKELDVAIKSLRKTGSEYARAYTDYRVALAKEQERKKNEGYAITLAGDISRGNPEVAKLKYKEISSEAIYFANREAINSLKLQIKILQEQINKEWTYEGDMEKYS